MNTWPERKSQLPPDARAVVEAARVERQESTELRAHLAQVKDDLAELIRRSVREMAPGNLGTSEPTDRF